MTVGTLAQEVSKLTANEIAGIDGLGVRDQLILKLVNDATVTAIPASNNISAVSGTNGEISVAGMTSNGRVVITPMEACPAVHVVPASGKITVFEANTTNVINAKKLAVLILAK